MDEGMKDLKENVHKLVILVEDLRDQVKIVAEGVVTLDEKLDRRTDGLEKKINDTQTMMGVMYKDLDKKIDDTAQKLDKKIDETKKELKSDILRVENKVMVFDARLDEHEKVMNMHHH